MVPIWQHQVDDLNHVQRYIMNYNLKSMYIFLRLTFSLRNINEGKIYP